MKKYALGIDLGGTGTKFGLVNDEGKVLRWDSIPTPQYPNIDEYCDVLCAGLKRLVADEGLTMADIIGIGCGAPNANFYSGCIEQAPNLPWKGVVPLAKLISERMGVKCTITNDANAAAQGERIYGSARGMKNFIVITLGTGVGSGIVIDGKLLYGHDQPTLLRQVADIDHITSKDVFDAAEKGDLVAKEIFDYTGHLLGEKLADFVHFSSPEAIILFGGLTKSGHWIMDPIREALDANLMPIWKGKIPVSISVLKDSDAAILGASSLAW